MRAASVIIRYLSTKLEARALDDRHGFVAVFVNKQLRMGETFAVLDPNKLILPPALHDADITQSRPPSRPVAEKYLSTAVDAFKS